MIPPTEGLLDVFPVFSPITSSSVHNVMICIFWTVRMESAKDVLIQLLAVLGVEIQILRLNAKMTMMLFLQIDII